MHKTSSAVGPWKLALAVTATAVLIATAEQQPPAQAPTQQPSDIGAVITGDPGAAPRYAVPDFVALTPNAAEVGRMLGQVLWDDLNFERDVYMIARDTYKTIPAARTAQQIPFASWRELGADALVFGSVEQTGNDVTVAVRVYDVRAQTLVLGQEFTTPARNARRVAHTIANLIHQQQRNLKGVALTRLAFISDRQRQSLLGTVETRDAKEIYVTDYDGANPQPITITKQMNLAPSWSGDARAIAYASYPSSGDPRPTILIAHILTGIRQQLLRVEGSHTLPAFSPDGRRIAYQSARNGNVDVYVANADGSNERRLTTHPDADSAPAWSPAGNQIVFTSDRAGGARPKLYLMSDDGTNQRALPIPDSWADRPTWSPSPYNEIAYAAQTGPGFDIKIIDMSTNQIRQLTHGEGSNESPSFSPTGRHVAFQSSRGAGRFQIYTIARTGDPATLRQITREGENKMPDWSN